MSNKNNYISVYIPEKTKEQIKLLQNIIIKSDSKFKPVEYNDLHMTLLFMGETFCKKK